MPRTSVVSEQSAEPPLQGAPPSNSLQPGQLAVLVTFSVISSTLLLINKLTLNHIPLPALVSTLQFVVAAGTACEMELEPVEPERCDDGSQASTGTRT